MRASLFQDQLPAVSSLQVRHLLGYWHFSFASAAPMSGLRDLLAALCYALV